MATGIYVGVGDKARKVSKAYLGIGGKARKITKGYVGDSNGKARLFFNPLIQFYILSEGGIGDTYSADKGMTWGEWVDSSYNIDGYKTNSNNIVDVYGNEMVCRDNTGLSSKVYKSDLIINDHQYSRVRIVEIEEPDVPL